jgi:predicted dehydrogenase
LALVDPQEQRRSKLLEYFPTARPYPDLATMIEKAKPELAIIAVPHQFHASLTEQCLNNGIHVLCEKPIATTIAECDRMIAAAEKAGRILAVGHFRRFYPACETIKNFLDSNCLGRVESFRFFEGYRYNWPLASASVFSKESAGGGVLIDTGAHALDLLLWWLGDIFDFTYKDDAMGGVEANCELHLKMRSGAVGTVRLSRDWPLPNHCFIKCQNGWIKYTCDVTDRIEWGFYGSAATLGTQVLGENNGIRRASDNPLLNCFTAQVRNVVEAIRGREPVRVPGHDARKVMELIEKSYSRRELLPMGWLDGVETQRAMELANVD